MVCVGYWRYGCGSLYIFITILFFINEDLRMSLFCSPAMIFYYWTREFNQAIVSLSGNYFHPGPIRCDLFEFS